MHGSTRKVFGVVCYDADWMVRIGRQPRLNNSKDLQVLPRCEMLIVWAAGGIIPTDFLKNVGVQVQTKYGTA